jgi:phosphoribosylformimino-5-aminoimidazole carboxamide ribotide isomerase
MTKFRPCIDLHAGAVKQIVGGTLTTTSSDLQTNFTSEHGAAFYADLYKKHDLRGGHVIMLGPGNDQASKEALTAWPIGLQVGGGIKDTNAQYWIDAGAEKVGDICYAILQWFSSMPLCLNTSDFYSLSKQSR